VAVALGKEEYIDYGSEGIAHTHKWESLGEYSSAVCFYTMEPDLFATRHPDHEEHSADEILRLAGAKDRKFVGEYSVSLRTCEHFSFALSHGVSCSYQAGLLEAVGFRGKVKEYFELLGDYLK
jgi:hypothetical protein